MSKTVVLIGPFPEDPLVVHGGVQASVMGLADELSLGSWDLKVGVVGLPSASTRRGTAHRLELGRYCVDYVYPMAGGRLATVVFRVPEVWSIVRSYPDAVVHVHGTGPVQLCVILLCRLRGVRGIWTLHGLTRKETLSDLRRRRTIGLFLRFLYFWILESSLLNAASTTVVDTSYVRRSLGRRGRRVEVIPQGVVLGDFSSELVRPNLYNSSLLAVGVLSRRKGHHRVIRSFRLVVEAEPSARLVIAGTVTDVKYYEELKRIVADLHLQSSVEFRVGIPRSDMIALFQTSSIFVIGSDEESQGIAVCEAMAAGLPVVATRVGGIPDVVRDGDCGYLVELDDTFGMSDKILDLIRDVELWSNFSLNAIDAANGYSWPSIAGRLIQLY